MTKRSNQPQRPPRYQEHAYANDYDMKEFTRTTIPAQMTLDSLKRVDAELSQVNEELVRAKEELGRIKDEKSALRLENQRLSDELEHATGNKWVLFAIHLMATFCLGIGINLITATGAIYGWVFSGIAFVLELLAFFATKRQ
jgi:hypothetical protein